MRILRNVHGGSTGLTGQTIAVGVCATISPPYNRVGGAV